MPRSLPRQITPAIGIRQKTSGKFVEEQLKADNHLIENPQKEKQVLLPSVHSLWFLTNSHRQRYWVGSVWAHYRVPHFSTVLSCDIGRFFPQSENKRAVLFSHNPFPHDFPLDSSISTYFLGRSSCPGLKTLSKIRHQG